MAQGTESKRKSNKILKKKTKHISKLYSPTSMLNKTIIGKTLFTNLASEAFRMPTAIHGFDYTTNNEVTTFSTTRSKKYVKIVFAILSSIKLIKQNHKIYSKIYIIVYTIRKRLKTLGTTKQIIKLGNKKHTRNNQRGIFRYVPVQPFHLL